MELRNLQYFVCREAVPPSEVHCIAQQLLSALSYVHSKGIVHSDIKPDNILISRTPGNGPTATLIDFGSAAYIADRRQAAMGSPGYRAPEALLQAGWGAPADVWASGCVIAEMAAGQPLFPENGVREMYLYCIQIVLDQPIPPHLIRAAGSHPDRHDPARPPTVNAAGMLPAPAEKFSPRPQPLSCSVRNEAFLPLIRRMMAHDPALRITATQALLELPSLETASGVAQSSPPVEAESKSAVTTSSNVAYSDVENTSSEASAARPESVGHKVQSTPAPAGLAKSDRNESAKNESNRASLLATFSGTADEQILEATPRSSPNLTALQTSFQRRPERAMPDGMHEADSCSMATTAAGSISCKISSSSDRGLDPEEQGTVNNTALLAAASRRLEAEPAASIVATFQAGAAGAADAADVVTATVSPPAAVAAAVAGEDVGPAPPSSSCVSSRGRESGRPVAHGVVLYSAQRAGSIPCAAREESPLEARNAKLTVEMLAVASPVKQVPTAQKIEPVTTLAGGFRISSCPAKASDGRRRDSRQASPMEPNRSEAVQPAGPNPSSPLHVLQSSESAGRNGPSSDSAERASEGGNSTRRGIVLWQAQQARLHGDSPGPESSAPRGAERMPAAQPYRVLQPAAAPHNWYAPQQHGGMHGGGCMPGHASSAEPWLLLGPGGYGGDYGGGSGGYSAGPMWTPAPVSQSPSTPMWSQITGGQAMYGGWLL